MTAFARVQSGHLAWEIRSVNQRYLDPTFKLPENFRVLEPDLRNAIRNKLHRGKIDCLLRVDSSGAADAEAHLNEQQLRQVMHMVDEVASVSGNVAPVNPLELLRWPGVLTEDSEGFDAVLARVRALYMEGVDALVAMREREGTELERLILERLDSLASIVADVRSHAPELNERLANRLKDKLAELSAEADMGRLEQELVYLAQKSDVQEELDRLDAHIEEVRSTLAGGGAIGRRLDFLMQELNREANTLSSKSSAAEMSIQAVELKVIIEQMREQIQNIE